MKHDVVADDDERARSLRVSFTFDEAHWLVPVGNLDPSTTELTGHDCVHIPSVASAHPHR